jgi:hypothetical protein
MDKVREDNEKLATFVECVRSGIVFSRSLPYVEWMRFGGENYWYCDRVRDNGYRINK